MKRTLALTICLGLYVALWAASVTPVSGIAAYYAAVDGKSGKSLFDEVHDIAKLGYHSLGYDGLWSAYSETDLRADGTIWDMYSNCEYTLKAGKCGTYKNECDCYNREHSIPKSWFGGETAKPGCDIFHLVPTDGKVNGMRSNNPFGEVGTASYTSGNGSKLGTARSITITGKTVVSNSDFTATYSGKVFEPVDEYKGDFARAYFGTMIRWAGDYQAFTEGNGASTFSGNYTASGYFGLSKYGVALLLKWHRQDPVSQKEIDRNNGIQSTQGNRNPFIDYPYLAEYIWGVHAGEPVDIEQMIHSQDERFVPGVSDGSYVATEPTLTLSTNEIAFTGVMQGSSATQTFTLRGARLTTPVSLTLSGADAAMFSIAPATITAANANGVNTITVTYTPARDGSHKATLTVACADVPTQTLNLYGTCNEACTVTWIVDGTAYTNGSPTTTVPAGTRVSALPTAPQACDEQSETFVGWSEHIIESPQNEAPEDLFSDANEAPVVNHDVAYHAVFAHLTQSTGNPATWKTAYGSQSTDWVVKASSHSDYWVLNGSSYIESPEADLSNLQSVTITMRTYGGDSYGTIQMSCAGQSLGELSASNNKMADYTWTPTTVLSGTGPIRFTGKNTSAEFGPGVESIAIVSRGISYTYSRFITTCSQSPTEDVEVTEPSVQAVKIIRNSQLLILYQDKVYNAWGQLVEAK